MAGMKKQFSGLVVGVILLLVVFNVGSDHTTDVSTFGLYDDLQAQEQTATNIQYNDEGHALLTDTATSGSWVSLRENVSDMNETRLDVYMQSLNSNNSASATVTGFDSSGTETGSKTVSLSDGQTQVDLESGLGDPTEVELNVSFDRDSTSAQSPELTGYEGFEEGQVPYIKYIAVLFAAVLLIAATRSF